MRPARHPVGHQAPIWWRWLTQRDTWALIAIALLVRGTLFGILLREHGLHSAWYGWGAETGDTPGYFGPIDAYLDGKAYRPDHRMPGYGIVYLVFRTITTPQGAGSAIIVLQALLGIVSTVVLARTARLLGAPRWSQFLLCICYALLGRVVVYDVYWFTESFCTSAMIIGTHGWLVYQRTGSRALLIWAGAWLAWSVFLRPVQLVWLALLAVGTWGLGHSTWWKKCVAGMMLLLPFVLVDAWWVRRNAVMHGEFTPLSRGVIMPELASSPMYPLMRFLQATGGNYIHWDPSAHIRWFNMREGPLGRYGPREDRNVRMPGFALSANITADSLRAWATDMSRWSDERTTPDERNALFRRMNERSDRFVSDYRAKRPWQYFVGSRLRLTGYFFRLAGSGALFRPMAGDPMDRFFPTWSPLDLPMHWTVLAGGLLAAILLLRKWRSHPIIALLAAMTLLSVLLIPWGLRLCEGRYLVPMYPWLLLLLMLWISRVGRAPADTVR